MFALLALGGYWAAGEVGVDWGPFRASGMGKLVRGGGFGVSVLVAVGPNNGGRG